MSTTETAESPINNNNNKQTSTKDQHSILKMTITGNSYLEKSKNLNH